MIHAHIDQLHEGQWDLLQMLHLVQLAIMEVVVTEMAVCLVSVITTWMIVRRVKDVFLSRPPDPPDDDDDVDDDEDESSDEEDDERHRNRRSPRRRMSRDHRGSNNDRPRISWKEAKKVNVPPWPRITKLDSWKMAPTMNVTSASADPDTEAWMSWLACAFVVNPDLDSLADSGGERFAMLGIRLALALQMMLKSSPDDAKDVVHDLQLHAERR